MSAISFSPVATRFAWKEYRTLRGLWLAVLGLGLLVQLALMLLAAPGADVPFITLSAALASTVLYAVGAAAILFAVEHEDETYGFLAGLPTTWLPIFLTKLAAALWSSIAIAALLALTGGVVAGGRWPSASNCGLLFGLYGIAVLEAIVWGTLFSLLVKRPLVAVLWTLAVGSVAMHWAVNASSSSVTASSDLLAYSQAIHLRLSVVAGVLACATLAARRWLTTSRAANSTTREVAADAPAGRFAARWTFVGRSLTSFRARMLPPSVRQSSRRVALARLLWQGWRSSWKMLLLPFVVALSLYAGIVGIGGFIVGPEFANLVTMAFAFLLPTLYGAMAFGADQRRVSYRFLAEHAARPRDVWLSRHLIWLGSLLLLCFALVVIATIVAVFGLEYATGRNLRNEYWLASQSTDSITSELHRTLNFVISGSLLAWLGALTAYSIGQLCSMLLRSEILAAFLGVVLSTVLSAWLAVVLLWDLDPWLCLFPLFGGLMLATWLRAPDWIVGRNSWHSWWKPALAAALPIVLLGWMLPEMRRLPPLERGSFEVSFHMNPNHYANGDTPAARETAAMYQRTAKIPLGLYDQKFFDRWFKREFAAEEDGLGYAGIDETKMSAKQRDEYRQDLKERQQIRNENLRRVARIVIAASHRPSCRFEVTGSGTPVPTDSDWYDEDRDRSWIKTHPDFYNAMMLPANVPFAELPPAEAVEFQLAALRMFDHLRQGQTTSVAYRVLAEERRFLARMVAWADNPALPAADVRKLLAELQRYFRRAPIDPSAPFLADDRNVREVLLGRTPPQILEGQDVGYPKYLAYLANELPWERERAFAALDRITSQYQRESAILANFMDSSRHDSFPYQRLQRWLPYRYSTNENNDLWSGPLSDAATSYLARLEYDARVPVSRWFQQVLDAETCRRAAVVRIALVLYRRDHGKYPDLLTALVPTYLATLPGDPFSGSTQPFSYAPAGVDLPLQRNLLWGADRIAAKAPFIWSAGPANARLKKRESASWSSTGSDPAEEQVERKEFYYVLEGDRDAWARFDPALVFPLPMAPRTD